MMGVSKEEQVVGNWAQTPAAFQEVVWDRLFYRGEKAGKFIHQLLSLSDCPVALGADRNSGEMPSGGVYGNPKQDTKNIYLLTSLLGQQFLY